MDRLLTVTDKNGVTHKLFSLSGYGQSPELRNSGYIDFDYVERLFKLIENPETSDHKKLEAAEGLIFLENFVQAYYRNRGTEIFSKLDEKQKRKYYQNKDALERDVCNRDWRNPLPQAGSDREAELETFNELAEARKKIKKEKLSKIRKKPKKTA